MRWGWTREKGDTLYSRLMGDAIVKIHSHLIAQSIVHQPLRYLLH